MQSCEITNLVFEKGYNDFPSKNLKVNVLVVISQTKPKKPAIQNKKYNQLSILNIKIRIVDLLVLPQCNNYIYKLK